MKYNTTLRSATCFSQFVKTDSAVIAVNDISSIDCTRLKDLHISILTKQGLSYTATRINALELILQIRPSALEGIGLQAPKLAWCIHNLIAHPMMQILALFHFYSLAFWVHDITVPSQLTNKLKS